MKRRGKQLKQYNLFGDPIEFSSPPSTEIVPLDFETHAVRMVLIKGDPWWVLADVARVLGYRDAANAGRILRDREKGTHLMSTLGGTQQLIIISESGLYRLIMRSEQPEAERFQDWVTEEVLPSIRRTGSYTKRTDNKVARTAKRIKSDTNTAIERLKNTDQNKIVHARLSNEGACPNDYRDYHNAAYRGMFGRSCGELRTVLGIPRWDTPLDHMSGLVLANNSHLKWLADRKIRDNPEQMSMEDQCQLVEELGHQMVEADLATLGPNYQLGICEDPKRGKLLDVVRGQLAKPH